MKIIKIQQSLWQHNSSGDHALKRRIHVVEKSSFFIWLNQTVAVPFLLNQKLNEELNNLASKNE